MNIDVFSKHKILFYCQLNQLVKCLQHPILYIIRVNNVCLDFFTCLTFIRFLCLIAYLCFGFISFYLVVSLKDIGVFSCVVSTAPQLVWTFQIESCSVTKMFQYCPLQSLLQEVFYHSPLGWFITACCCFFWRCF